MWIAVLSGRASDLLPLVTQAKNNSNSCNVSSGAKEGERESNGNREMILATEWGRMGPLVFTSEHKALRPDIFTSVWSTKLEWKYDQGRQKKWFGGRDEHEHKFQYYELLVTKWWKYREILTHTPLEEEGSWQNWIRAFVTGAKKEISKSFLSSIQATSALWIARLSGGLTLSLKRRRKTLTDKKCSALSLYKLSTHHHICLCTFLARVINQSFPARDLTQCGQHKAVGNCHRCWWVPRWCSRWLCERLAALLQAAASQWSDQLPES